MVHEPDRKAILVDLVVPLEEDHRHNGHGVEDTKRIRVPQVVQFRLAASALPGDDKEADGKHDEHSDQAEPQVGHEHVQEYQEVDGHFGGFEERLVNYYMASDMF